MNRYWLFAGLTYYPMGGFADFRGSFKTLNSAKLFLKELKVDSSGRSLSQDGYPVNMTFCQWFQIIDSKTGQILDESN